VSTPPLPRPSRDRAAAHRPERPGLVELGRFAVTGLVAFVVDVAVFNLVLLGLGGGPVTAKVVSSVAAITTAFLGSRYYTWADRPRRDPVRQYALFFVLSVIAAGIQILTIVVANDVLGFTGPVADNISGNVVGMGLATIFRFFTFRRFVFT
jgi:putative flippase GtrA